MSNCNKPVRIAINALSARRGGGQTYLCNLFQFLPQDKQLEIFLLAPNSLSIPEYPNLKSIRVGRIAENPFLRALWEKVEMPKLLKKMQVDLLFCPGGVIGVKPPKGCKTVTMLQNMLPFVPREQKRYPLGYMRFRLWLLRFLQSQSFKQADLVIFVSQYAKDVIDELFPARRGQSIVIQHGISDHFRYNSNRPFPESMPREYVLYVSILDVYKAQLEVVQSWYLLRQQRQTPEKLVFIGPEYPPYAKRVKQLIHSLGLEDEVILLGKVPHEQLPAFYQHAKVNIFASSCESFGMTLIEAMAAKSPVLCSHYQPMTDNAEDAVEYFDPYEPQTLTELLLKYLDDAKLRETMGQKALVQCQRYCWKDTASKTWEIMAKLGARCAQ
ncbi:MAG: glycosyltransferase family 4 protein [Xenococcaceae cyanobacterium]